MKSVIVIILVGIVCIANAQTDSSRFKVNVMVFNQEGDVVPIGIRSGYSAKKRDYCPNYDSVKLVSYNGDDFYKVEYKPAGMPLRYYYVHIKFLRSDPWAVTFINNFQISQGSSFRLIYVDAPPDTRNLDNRSVSKKGNWN